MPDINNDFSFIIISLIIGSIVLLSIIAWSFWAKSKRYTKSDLYRDNPHMRKRRRRRSEK